MSRVRIISFVVFFNGALVFMHLQNTSRAAVPARRGRHIRVFLSARNLSGAPMTFSPLNNSTRRESVVLVLPVSRMPLAHILTFRLVYTDPAVLSVKCDSRFERPAYQQSRLVFRVSQDAGKMASASMSKRPFDSRLGFGAGSIFPLAQPQTVALCLSDTSVAPQSETAVPASM